MVVVGLVAGLVLGPVWSLGVLQLSVVALTQTNEVDSFRWLLPIWFVASIGPLLVFRMMSRKRPFWRDDAYHPMWFGAVLGALAGPFIAAVFVPGIALLLLFTGG